MADTGGETGGETGGSSGGESTSESGGDSSPRPSDSSMFSCASGDTPVGGLLLSGALALSLVRRRRSRP